MIPETEFFCGVWHPHASLEVDLAVEKGALPVRVASGDNWWLAATELDFGDSARSLVQEGEGACDAFIFRGYLLDPVVQGWSEPATVRRKLGRGLPDVPNGVFAMASIRDSGRRLELTTDLLGVSPLYLRRENELVLFANSPRLLSAAGDELDRLAGRALLDGTLCSDYTLNTRVRRLEPGVQLALSADGESRTPRPGLEFLPEASRPIDSAAIEELEARWRQSMRRCLEVPGEDRLLLLSSGLDSRRTLLSLLAEKADFHARTMKVLDRHGRDIDARFACELAHRFGFRHEVILPARGDRAVAMDRDRRILLDSESRNHSWFLPLFERSESRGTLIFDGLAGDVLGETGFGFLDAEIFQVSLPDARPWIAERMAGSSYDHLLHPNRWPSRITASTAVAEWVRALPDAQVRELAFLLSHTRRNISVATQWLVPAGTTAVCPCLELDYLVFALALEPREKLVRSTQERCLERFWPEAASIPGSRNIPDGLEPERPGADDDVALALMRARDRELREIGRRGAFLRSLRLRPRTQARLGIAPGAAEWWHGPISELFLCESLRVPAWGPLRSD